MDILFFALGLLVAGAVNVVCVIAGASIVQKASRGQPVQPEIPKREKPVAVGKEPKEDEPGRKRREVILENIERYNGSPDGQKNVPM